MGTISTGTGLVSGINSEQIISQLLQIEARPRALAQQRLVQLQGQQAAFLDLNSAVRGLEEAAGAFRAEQVFRGSRAVSTNPDALTANARAGAATGTFDFIVSRLVSTEQQISRGFTDRDTSAIGLDTLTVETGGGRLDSDTKLADLNGGLGVERGEITVKDRAGGSATIDLSRAVSVNDVLEAINSAGGVEVRARADDDRIVLEDSSGGSGNLVVQDVFGSATATSLGIAGSVSANTLTGDRINELGDATPLSLLNDGAGVSFRPGGASSPFDFEITVDDGTAETFEIRLGELGSNQPDPDDPDETIYVVEDGPVATIGDLKARIEEQTGGAVTVEINAEGNGLDLVAADPSADITARGNLASDVAIFDLGFVQRGETSATSTGTLNGGAVLAGINSTLARSLNGGAGVGAGDVDFTAADGSAFSVSIDADDSVSTIIDKINDASGGAVTAALNNAGNGLRVTDNTTGGGSLVIADDGGTAAEDLNIATAGADGAVDSGNLQSRWISEATRLDDLNGGEGVGTGSFTITDSSGASSTINISGDEITLRDIIAEINGRPGIDVVARINDNGDGLIIEDAAGGSNALTIADDTGRVARDLNIAGEAEDPENDNAINGSYERTIDVDPGATLEEVADAINAADAGVSASIVSSGGGPAPFRLNLASDVSGERGRIAVDTGGFDLGLDTLTRGEDAVVFFGSGDPADGVLLTSGDNTIEDAVQGVTIDLRSVSEDPVSVTVSRDVEGIESALSDFADAFNNALDRVDFHTRFDQETEERGALLGDGTVANVRQRLFSALQSPAKGVDGQFQFLFEIGLTIGDGARLEFDSDRFREAYAEDPAAVAELVASLEAGERETETEIAPGVTVQNTDPQEFETQGVAEIIKGVADAITDSIDGTLARREDTLDNQIRLQEDRIQDLTEQLEVKRQRLQQQFLAMEQAIAQLQNQQSSLGNIGGGGGFGGF